MLLAERTCPGARSVKRHDGPVGCSNEAMIYGAGVGVVSGDCSRRIDAAGEGALGRAKNIERGDGTVSSSQEAVIEEGSVGVEIP
jgi:hypothetical protein